MVKHLLVCSSLFSLAFLAACDENKNTTAAGKGGSPTQGGKVSSGGSTASGGATSAGGATGSGGVSGSGGAAMTGGATVTGGTTSNGGSTSAGGTTGNGGSTGAGGATGGNPLLLPQDGNPVHVRFDLYKGFLDKADILLSYQLTNGGWPKNQEYLVMGNGGNDLGTFDNGATTLEMTVMADSYKKTKDKKYLDSARKAMDFILKAQYPSGGWPQFYPLRGGYSDHVTYNDNAMSRVLTVLQHALDKTDPFDTDVFTEEQRSQFQKAIDGGVDYTLKAQITQNGKKTAWCAQSGVTDYAPKLARAYEHPSISGSESIEVIGFLMTQPQTPEIKAAVVAALDWFRSPTTYYADLFYDKTKEDSNPFVPQVGSKTWCRFYDIQTNKCIFSNYDGAIHLGLENQDKKKSGYRWGGNFGDRILPYAEKVGY